MIAQPVRRQRSRTARLPSRRRDPRPRFGSRKAENQTRCLPGPPRLFPKEMQEMKEVILKAGGMLLLMAVLCGIVYTAVLTGVGQVLFPYQANGSVIEVDGKTYGSELLGQQFTSPGHMWGRVMNLDVNSFTDENGEPVMYATASNLSPASPEYEALVAERVEALHAADPDMADVPIPADLVTCSGSGLDPAISPEAAEYQVHRIAQARGISEDDVRRVIQACTKGRVLGFLGEPTVNVLKVNLMLDGILETP